MLNDLRREIDMKNDFYEGNKIFNSLVNEAKKLYTKKSLLINDFFHKEIDKLIIKNNEFSENIKFSDIDEFLKSNNEFYELITAVLPLGLPRIKYKNFDEEISLRGNHALILDILRRLDDNGVGFFVVEPNFFSNNHNFSKCLLLQNFQLVAALQLPSYSLPKIQIKPILIIIKKDSSCDEKMKGKLFVGKADSYDYKNLIQNFYFFRSSESIEKGQIVKLKDFKGFHYHDVIKKIEKLESQYKNYKKALFNNYIVTINYDKKKFQESKNCIFIPRFLNSNPVIDEDKIQDKKKYFQVILKNDLNNRYAEAMFKSNLGKLILSSSIGDSYIPHITINELRKTIIPVPDNKTQNDIALISKKINKLKKTIDSFDKIIALNPLGSDKLVEKIDQVSKAFEITTFEDNILSLIRSGESRTLEFKETFSLDTKNNEKRKDIEKSALKCIVGFLNTIGGELLIGVNDLGEILGVDQEINKFYKNNDKYLLHFNNKIKEKIGNTFTKYIEYRIISIHNKRILYIKCIKSKDPCFLDEKEFYIRNNPSTDILIGRKQFEYIKNNFNK